MIEIATQLIRVENYTGWAFIPHSQEDLEKAKEFKPFQILRSKFTGTKKQRSLQQNKWVHAIFRIVASNTSDEDWDTPEKVKRNVKMAMKFFKDEVIVHSNKVYFELRSFAFDKMDQNEANLKYEEAKNICAKKIGRKSSVLEVEAKRE